MALVFADRVKETTTTTGTGTYTLAGAAVGFQSFAAIGDGNTCYYAVTDGTNWEVGLGTYTLAGITLARTSVLASSNANAAVSWAAGTKSIWNDVPKTVIDTFMAAMPLSYLDTDTAMTANSDVKVASQKAVKTYVDGIIAAQDAMVFKGVIDCSANPNYPAASRGWTYRVSVAGKIGGASGVNVEIGDILICLTDGTASGDQATVGSAWAVIQTNLDGALTAASLGVSVEAYDALLAAIAALTTAAGQFIRLSGVDTVVAQNIVDTVSQSGGVPTGAIIEHGSNANGDYIRYADGTQICWFAESVTDQAINSAYGSLFIGSRTWTFPAAFSVAPTLPAPNARWGTGASWGSSNSPGTTSVAVRFFDASSRATGTAFTYGVAAVGRWY